MTKVETYIHLVLVISVLGCQKAPPPAGPPERSAAEAKAETPAPDASRATTPSTPIEIPEGMVKVSGGTFDMGLPKEISQGPGPIRTEVEAFLIDRTEVTVAQYRACVDAGTCSLSAHQPGCNATAKKTLHQHPMNCVTKDQAEQFCKAQGKRIPTEAEWEFAARGSDGRIYPWGNTEPFERVCWQGRTGAEDEKTCPVSSFPQSASPSGALDMAGNVAEWTATEETETAVPGAFRTRGGSYELDEVERAEPEGFAIRVDRKRSVGGDESRPTVGFRCAKNL